MRRAATAIAAVSFQFADVGFLRRPSCGVSESCEFLFTYRVKINPGLAGLFNEDVIFRGFCENFENCAERKDGN